MSKVKQKRSGAVALLVALILSVPCAGTSAKVTRVSSSRLSRVRFIYVLGLEHDGHEALHEALAPCFSSGVCVSAAGSGEVGETINRMIDASDLSTHAQLSAKVPRQLADLQFQLGVKKVPTMVLLNCAGPLGSLSSSCYSSADPLRHLDAATLSRFGREARVDLGFLVLLREPARLLASIPGGARARTVRVLLDQLAVLAAQLLEVGYDEPGGDALTFVDPDVLDAASLDALLQVLTVAASHGQGGRFLESYGELKEAAPADANFSSRRRLEDLTEEELAAEKSANSVALARAQYGHSQRRHRQEQERQETVRAAILAGTYGTSLRNKPPPLAGGVGHDADKSAHVEAKIVSALDEERAGKGQASRHARGPAILHQRAAKGRGNISTNRASATWKSRPAPVGSDHGLTAALRAADATRANVSHHWGGKPNSDGATPVQPVHGLGVTWDASRPMGQGHRRITSVSGSGGDATRNEDPMPASTFGTLHRELTMLHRRVVSLVLPLGVNINVRELHPQERSGAGLEQGVPRLPAYSPEWVFAKAGANVEAGPAKARIKVVFFAGLEGTGHHALGAILQPCLKTRSCITDCGKGGTGPSGAHPSLQALVWSLAVIDHHADKGDGRAEQAAWRDTVKKLVVAFRDLRVRLERAADLAARPLPLVALNLLCVPAATGQMSFPNGMPKVLADRPLLHPNLRLLAELVEGAGLDFRVVVLHRSPTDVLISTTVKRNFASFLAQARTLMVNEAVLAAQLSQLDRGFSLCASYNLLDDQAWQHQLFAFLGLNAGAVEAQARRRRLDEPDHNTTTGGRHLGAWKRAEGEAFDVDDAAPILRAFDSLHAHFLRFACGAPEHRRLATAGCVYQNWNKKLLCHPKEGDAGRYPLAPGPGQDEGAAVGSHIPPVSQHGNSFHGPVNPAIHSHNFEKESIAHAQYAARKNELPHGHQTARPSNASKSGFDIVVAHYSMSLDWLDPLLLRMSRSEATRVFVYLKGALPADRSHAALAAMVNLTFAPLFFHRLPNVGREGHTYIDHIMRLYDASNFDNVVGPAKRKTAAPDSALAATVDAAFHAAADAVVPWDRVLVFLKDSSTKEGGFDAKHNWQRHMKLLAMAEGARKEGLAGMDGVPPGVALHHTAMGQSWLKWEIRTAYQPTWRQSNGSLVHAHPKGILRWAQAHLQDPTALKHIATAKRICYKGIFACRAAAVLQFHPRMWRSAYMQLSEGDNVEAGHYMERLWCPLLFRAPEVIVAHSPSDAFIHEPVPDEKVQASDGGGDESYIHELHGYDSAARQWEHDRTSDAIIRDEEGSQLPDFRHKPEELDLYREAAVAIEASDRPLTTDELITELGNMVDRVPTGRRSDSGPPRDTSEKQRSQRGHYGEVNLKHVGVDKTDQLWRRT